MAKPEWGKKRTCASCGALFYDMKNNPAACPKCGAEDNLQPLLKPRRQPAAKPARAAAPAAANDDAESPDAPEDIEDVGMKDDEDDGLIVDDDDLGGDEDDDVSEVKEHMEPDDDKE